ncbi:MAG: phytoene/squalene synthase family protein [Burkholderiaceae bacterium]
MIAPADLAECRALLANGSRTFLAASFLLPRAVRDAACALYAFCRLADDAVDQVAAARAPQAIGTLRARLAAIYEGRPVDCAADRALAVVIRDYGIARALPEALIEGFEWDAAGRQVETLDDLHAYAARVAGSVGAMMALLMGARAPAELARACDLGVAMQLSNIARDVGDDARIGRLYLPRRWMREAGLDPDAWLADPVHSDALGSVVRRVLDEADRLYARVGVGVAQLPASCRPGINAARHLYAAIGHEVARRGFDAVSQRAFVPGRRKARLLLTSTLAALLPAIGAHARRSDAPLPATLFLVDAAADRSMRPLSATAPARWNIGARAVWTIELFERLERQDHEAMRWRPSNTIAREVAR